MKVKAKSIASPSERLLNVVFHIIMVILAVSCLYPFLVILGSSFQTQEEIMELGYRAIPKEFTMEAYKLIFLTPKSIIDAYVITFFTTLISTVCGLFLVSTCGYVMSRNDFAYKRVLSLFVFFTMLFNGGMVPSYILMTRWLGLKDSLLALIIPGMCTAWNILLMKGFFKTIPSSLIESAKLDGAGEFQIFARIILPISKPAFATVGLLLTLTFWNEWFNSLLYINDPTKVKLQYLLITMLRNVEFLSSPEAQQYGVLTGMETIPVMSVRMAMCVLAAGPILLVFPFFQKYFVKGLTVGAVKG